ncbi:MAG: class B sortase, partial [Oscillospiraceae bacterium]|nr:class B sortase [Oscillospiraceae bacterium]
YDAEKRYTQRGAIFANALGSTDFDTGIVLLHGHNMKDGSMFTQLRKYKGETFFNQCGLVEVFDGKYLRLYQPYTVLLLHDNALMIDVREKTGEEHAAYLKKLAGDSMLPPRQDIQPDYSAPALFMSTCDYTFADARLVIGCYQVSKIAYKNAETTAEATGTTTEETAETAETEETVETGDPAETTNTETVTEE